MEQAQPKKTSKATAGSEQVLDIKTLKTYRPVKFGRDVDSFFTAKRPGMEGMTIKFDTARQLIIIEQPNVDRKIVLPANVEFMED